MASQVIASARPSASTNSSRLAAQQAYDHRRVTAFKHITLLDRGFDTLYIDEDFLARLPVDLDDEATIREAGHVW